MTAPGQASRLQPAARGGVALRAAALLLLALWAYWPALRGGWVWDDVEDITQNPVLRDPSGLAKIWSGSAGPDYFPLTSSLEWLEWRWWGPDPAGYHAAGLFLHLLSAILFWLLLARLFEQARPGGARSPGPWIGALLFAVHPLAVESVAWAAELKNTLALPLLLAALLSYLRFEEGGGGWREGRRGGWYLASLACFALSLLAKTSAVLIPFALLLHAWWRRGRLRGRDLGIAAPFFAVSLMLGWVTLTFQQHRAIAAGHAWAGGWAERVAAAGLSLAFYAGKAAAPFGLLPIYPRWRIDPASALDYLPWLALILAFAWFWRSRAGWGRHALLGFGFFVLSLAPVLGFANMSYLRISRVADHFAYGALLGAAGLAGAGIGAGLRAAGRGSGRVLLRAAAGLLVLGLAWQTRRYAAVFHDERTLWTYVLGRNPAAWLAQGNLGYALAQQGRPAEAIPHYREALRLKPDYVEARYNLAAALVATGQLEEGIGQYEQALRLQPDSAGLENNLASALVRAGRMPEALAHFERAAELDPGNAQAHHNLGNAMLLTGRLPEAVREYETALRLQPDDAAARAGLELARRALASQNR